MYCEMMISYQGLASADRGHVLWQFTCLAMMWVTGLCGAIEILGSFSIRQELQRVLKT